MDGAEHPATKGESLIKTTNPGRFVIDATPALIAALKEYGIYFSSSGENRFAKGDMLHYSGKTRVERYSGFLAGDTIFSLGAFSYSASALRPKALVGRYCSIASGVTHFGANHPTHTVSSSSFFFANQKELYRRPLDDAGLAALPYIDPRPPRAMGIIENDVWIGEGVAIGPGVTIGTGAVVGAHAVVTKDVEPYAVVAGVPARTIRKRFSDDVIERLLVSHWWDYNLAQLYQMPWADPVAFLDAFEERRESRALERLGAPRRFLEVLSELGFS